MSVWCVLWSAKAAGNREELVVRGERWSPRSPTKHHMIHRADFGNKFNLGWEYLLSCWSQLGLCYGMQWPMRFLNRNQAQCMRSEASDVKQPVKNPWISQQQKANPWIAKKGLLMCYVEGLNYMCTYAELSYLSNFWNFSNVCFGGDECFECQKSDKDMFFKWIDTKGNVQACDGINACGLIVSFIYRSKKCHYEYEEYRVSSRIWRAKQRLPSSMECLLCTENKLLLWKNCNLIARAQQILW